MAKYVYDKHGRKVGEILNEQEEYERNGCFPRFFRWIVGICILLSILFAIIGS